MLGFSVHNHIQKDLGPPSLFLEYQKSVLSDKGGRSMNLCPFSAWCLQWLLNSIFFIFSHKQRTFLAR
jgi:hypothetical protein